MNLMRLLQEMIKTHGFLTKTQHVLHKTKIKEVKISHLCKI